MEMEYDNPRVDMSQFGEDFSSFLGKSQGKRVVQMRFDITEVMKSLTYRLPRALKVGIAQGFASASAKLLRIANRYTPIDTGKLINTGKIINDTGLSSDSVSSGLGANAYRVGIQYGDASLRYSLYVHEDTEANHGEMFNAMHQDDDDFHPRRPQEQALWMDKAMEEGAPMIQDVLTRSIQSSFRNTLRNAKALGITSAFGNLARLKDASENWEADLGW